VTKSQVQSLKSHQSFLVIHQQSSQDGIRGCHVYSSQGVSIYFEKLNRYNRIYSLVQSHRAYITGQIQLLHLHSFRGSFRDQISFRQSTFRQ
jgi:hypothetical protein